LKASKARFHFRIAAFSNYKENRQPDPCQHASSLFLNVFGTVFTLKADSTPFPPQAELLALAAKQHYINNLARIPTIVLCARISPISAWDGSTRTSSQPPRQTAILDKLQIRKMK